MEQKAVQNQGSQESQAETQLRRPHPQTTFIGQQLQNATTKLGNFIDNLSILNYQFCPIENQRYVK